MIGFRSGDRNTDLLFTIADKMRIDKPIIDGELVHVVIKYERMRSENGR